MAGCSSAGLFFEIWLPLGLSRCLHGTEAASGLVRGRGGSKGTEEYHLVKGVLGSVPQQHRARLRLLLTDSSPASLRVFCTLNFCSNCLGAFLGGG